RSSPSPGRLMDLLAPPIRLPAWCAVPTRRTLPGMPAPPAWLTLPVRRTLPGAVPRPRGEGLDVREAVPLPTVPGQVAALGDGDLQVRGAGRHGPPGVAGEGTLKQVPVRV